MFLTCQAQSISSIPGEGTFFLLEDKAELPTTHRGIQGAPSPQINTLAHLLQSNVTVNGTTALAQAGDVPF